MQQHRVVNPTLDWLTFKLVARQILCIFLLDMYNGKSFVAGRALSYSGAPDVDVCEYTDCVRTWSYFLSI